MKIYFTLITIIMFGCSSISITIPTDLTDKIEYNDGNPVVFSEKVNSVALTVLTSICTSENKPSFYVLITNQTDSTFNIGPQSIKASYYGKRRRSATANNDILELDLSSESKDTTDYKRVAFYDLHVYTHEELVKEANDAANAAALAMVLSAASASIRASQASYSYGSTTYTGYGNYGNTRFNYLGNSVSRLTTRDPAMISLAQSQIRSNLMNEMSLVSNDLVGAINSLDAVLKINTLHPGDAVGGVVKIEFPPLQEIPSKLKLKINLPNEAHEFLLDYATIKQTTQNSSSSASSAFE